MLLALLLALVVQDESPSGPFDRVVELELTADDPVMIEGKGPTVTLEHEVEFEGTLHIWTRSELDLFLQVEDANEWRTLGEDEDSGGGTTPYMELEVREGDRLLVLVAAADAADAGPLSLHLMSAPETERTRAAAASGRQILAATASLVAKGRRAEARKRIHETVNELIGTPGALDSEAVSKTLFVLGLLAFNELADYDDSHAAWAMARRHRERRLPATHEDLLAARTNLANAMLRTGDPAGARELHEGVLAVFEGVLPEDHPSRLSAQSNLALSMVAMGRAAEALPIQRSVLAARERTLRANHPHILDTRISLANTLREIGILAEARALQEQVIEVWERTRPADDQDLLVARQILAASMAEMGDLAGARALQEAVLAALERTLPADHLDVLGARANLALSMRMMGDAIGARGLQESVLAAYERTLPVDHRDVLRARQNLASSMLLTGDLAGARALEEAVVASFEHTLPAGHPELLRAKASLAISMDASGRFAEACALRKEVLAAYERTLPAEHPDVLSARGGLAISVHATGDLSGALALQEQVLVARERSLPPGHPDLLSARQNVIISRTDTGDLEGARMLLPALVRGMRARVLEAFALAPRQARQVVASEAERLAEVLFVSGEAGSQLEREAFELVETMRLVTGEAARSLARFDQSPEIARILTQAGAVRAALSDLVAGAGDTGSDELSEELTRLSLERDRLEREASRRLARRGVVTDPVEMGKLAAALGEGDVAAGFRRVSVREMDETSGRIRPGADHLIAHVLAHDGSLKRVDLGEASKLEMLASHWRAALGAPLLRGIGRETEGKGVRPEEETGSALRSRLLDPILAVVGEETQRVFVCADDLAYLVPLDALPLDEGRVGDRFQLANEVSFARLQQPWAPLDAEPGILALGGVDYDASEAPEAAGSTSRSSLPDRFTPLLQARFEVETTGALFQDFVGVEPVVLTKDKATKAALFEHAPGKRYIHLATHGWFAPETIKSTLDPEPGASGWTRMGLQEQVTGLVPMLLCGLAFAGANQPRDSLGRMNGILTAEELCSLDLSQCELAVLSACETNVGIRRAGQGIQSLQAALYAAGVRSSITSLWKVDDAATRRLFEIFYTKLWEENLPKAQALWEAKCVLRKEGAPVRDWAGWVLTGDPD